MRAVRNMANTVRSRIFLVREDKRVNFVICGTQKGGTTALDAYLRTHPDICMASTKEVHFFDNEQIFSKKYVDYSIYHQFFCPRSTQRIIGEATPNYMYWYDATKRIWQYNSSMKIIVILRNPIERAYSHWNMERQRKAESLSFWDALCSERTRSRESLPFQHLTYSYISRGFYLDQLRRIWNFFPEEQVLVLKNEELRDNPETTMSRVCTFLGVRNFNHVSALEVHKSKYDAPIGDKEKEYLQSVFEHEIRGMQTVLGWNCEKWLSE